MTLPFANSSVGIQGVFVSDNDPFDPSRHAVVARVQAGVALRQAFASGAAVERVAARRPVPDLLHVMDLNTGEQDGGLTPGGMVEVTGTRLRTDLDVAGEGVFFVAEADGAETPVAVLGQSTPRRLLLVVPAGLASGGYRGVVRALSGTELREGRSDAVLSVS